jgi:hypothetical protein
MVESMTTSRHGFRERLNPSTLLNAAIFLVLAALPCRAEADPLHLSPGRLELTVKPAFGGTILGFDIDSVALKAC